MSFKNITNLIAVRLLDDTYPLRRLSREMDREPFLEYCKDRFYPIEKVVGAAYENN